jgi:opacity protein-like surface antigen
MKRTALILAAAALTASALAACQKQVKAPDTPGVCYQAVPRTDGTVTFNQLSAHEDTMEACAGALEGMRQRFLGMGGSVHNIMGAYNGSYLFLDPGGVYESQSYGGTRFPFLIHTDDGRLVAPGQPQQ